MATDSTDEHVPREIATVSHEWDEDLNVCTAVVSAVAAATDRPALELSPLRSTIDPDALSRIVASENGRGPVSVSFTYEGQHVSVDSDGQITVWTAADADT